MNINNSIWEFIMVINTCIVYEKINRFNAFTRFVGRFYIVYFTIEWKLFSNLARSFNLFYRLFLISIPLPSITPYFLIQKCLQTDTNRTKGKEGKVAILASPTL